MSLLLLLSCVVRGDTSPRPGNHVWTPQCEDNGVCWLAPPPMKGLAVLDRDHAVAVAGQYAVQLDNGFWSLTRMPGYASFAVTFHNEEPLVGLGRSVFNLRTGELVETADPVHRMQSHKGKVYWASSNALARGLDAKPQTVEGGAIHELLSMDSGLWARQGSGVQRMAPAEAPIRFKGTAKGMLDVGGPVPAIWKSGHDLYTWDGSFWLPDEKVPPHTGAITSTPAGLVFADSKTASIQGHSIASSEHFVVAAGLAGVSTWSGDRWLHVGQGPRLPQRCQTLGDSVWVAGTDGSMGRYRDGAWTSSHLGQHGHDTADVDMDAYDEVLTVSMNRELWTWAGSWNKVDLPLHARAHDTANADTTWVVGTKGSMARVHRGEVTLFDTGTAVHVMDVWAASPDEAWAVTQNNVLIHVLDGEVTTRSISRGSGSAGLVIGHEGEVVAGAGRLQLVQTAGPSGHIGPGNNLSPRDGQVVGDDLLVLSTRALERWDGVAWTRTDVPPHALTFTVADDGTYVSGKGELWRTQGNEVTVVETPLAKDICPLPTGGVMLVGDGLRTWTP